MAQQTTTILQSEYGKFKEVQQQLEVVTSQETTLNTILNNWPSYFSTTYNKLKAQKTIIVDLRTTRVLTTDPKSKLAISNHIAKEKEFEEELSKKEREWLKEARKAQVETENPSNTSTKLKRKLKKPNKTSTQSQLQCRKPLWQKN
jgi:hypothetical protein